MGGPPWVRYGIIAALLSVAGCCGLGMWRMGTAMQDAQKMMQDAIEKQEAERKARTVVVTATDMLKEFDNDAASADLKYKGKFLELTGIVEKRGKSGGLVFVILKGNDAEGPLKIECFFGYLDEMDDTVDQLLAVGRPLTVRGEYSGRVTNLQVRGCMLGR